jgi:hypothetical protein
MSKTGRDNVTQFPPPPPTSEPPVKLKDAGIFRMVCNWKIARAR